MRNRGVTLLELMIVVVIIGIIATVGISQYQAAQERARGQEAVANLILIAQAEKIYRMERGTYYPSSGTESAISSINQNLKLMLNERDWDYSITGGSSSFTAYADRIGTGGYLNCSYRINQTQERPVINSTPCAYIP